MATFTEFYCDSVNGSNFNGGGLASGVPGASPVYTFANGSWDGTSVYTPGSGNPSATVNVGDWGAIFPHGASEPAGYIARVTAVSSTTITFSTTAKFGTAPGSSSTVDVNVGGLWKGPHAAIAFPFGQITPAATDSSSHPPRANFKNNGTYSISAGMVATFSVNGFVTFQGCTSTAGDGGRATFDGGGGTFDMLTYTGNVTNRAIVLADLIFTNSGGTGKGIVLASTGHDTLLIRVVSHNMSNHGFSAANGVFARFHECEAYSNGGAGFSCNGVFTYCISHGNTGAGFITTDFDVQALPTFINCIADSNGSHGFQSADNIGMMLIQCDSYNNTGDGARLGITSGETQSFTAQNCNFLKNNGWGINQQNAGNVTGFFFNCGFGSGTQLNNSGNNGFGASNLNAVDNQIANTGTSVTYASGVTPWNAPSTGDFTITLSAAKGAGRATFTETKGGYTGTSGHPDIGSAQHLESASAGMILARVRTGF